MIEKAYIWSSTDRVEFTDRHGVIRIPELYPDGRIGFPFLSEVPTAIKKKVIKLFQSQQRYTKKHGPLSNICIELRD